jgi:hypothetical protein
MVVMKVEPNGVAHWWERLERPMTEREKHMAALRAKAEAGAPIVRAPLEHRYGGILSRDPDNPLARPAHERFDFPPKGDGDGHDRACRQHHPP